MSFRLDIENGQFHDSRGRQVVLRGINVTGDAKLPSEPNQPSHESEDFFDGESVTFHQRPFPVEDAAMHFERIRRYGFNTIRYVFTWEAIEHAGPGQYDEKFIQHTIEILRVAKSFDLYVFMDPHQDVWSRFTGGSGAPMWTVYACGLNPQSFAATQAAIVHNTIPDPQNFPKMIWATNYSRLAAATIFTMFFAGKDFTPKCVIDGVNIQDYLQTHFVNAIGHLAKRLKEAGDVLDEVVMGWESMNEPNRGLIGYVDLAVFPKMNPLKKGTCPTMWQTFLTGMGRACEIDTWEMGSLGPYRTGKTLVDPQGEIAWLPVGYDDSRYGWKRDPGWKLGECVWAQHGVWKMESDKLLRKDYFSKNPHTGVIIDYPEFTNTYFMDFYRRSKEACRTQHDNCIMFLHYPVLEYPPDTQGTEDEDRRTAFTPHYYDGITLMTKHWNSTWNVDVIGILRGKYSHPAFAIKIGETAIRNCMRDQLATLRQEGLDRMGKYPCVLTEYGVPFDMDDKKAYKTGDYSSQSAALDANCFAAEGANMEGHFLWVYTANNDHQWGDQWNGEDLSLASLDDRLPPVSALPQAAPLQNSTSDKTPTARYKDIPGESSVTPANIQRTLTNPSISSEPLKKDPELTNSPGYRAAEAFVRPNPVAVAGTIVSHGFDLRHSTLHLAVSAPKPTAEDAPTVVYLPEFHFPRDLCEVTVSAGKWEISLDDEGSRVPLQQLRWWHPQGEQKLRVEGVVRKHNVPEGAVEDEGYLEQCQQGTGVNLGSCTVM